MAAVTMERRVDELVRRCYTGLDAASLGAEVVRRLRAIVPVDAAFLATVDPATVLFTSVLTQDDPLRASTPLFIDNEFGRHDVNKFASLAAGADPVRSLDRATSGDRPASARYAEVMAPLQLGDELRAALVAGGHCWGVMCLHREDGPAGFSAGEIDVVRRLAPHVGEGLRRAVVLQGVAEQTEARAGPGVVVLDDDLVVTSLNPQAERLLADLVDGPWANDGPLPVPIHAAAAQVGRQGGELDPLPATTRLRTRSGQWLSVHASRLGGATGSQTAVVLESADPAQMASLLLGAHGLTPAQTRVAELVLQGRSTRQIVNELRISSYTVQEHLRAVFDKFGVGSRRELVAGLLGPRR